MKKRSWREAVQQVMKTAAELETVKKCKTEQPCFYYRWEHVQAVVTLSVRLAEQVGGDVEIAEAAAWLHDIKKYEAKERHPQEGGRFARTFLRLTDFPEHKIEAVAHAIEQHMGLWLDEPLTDLHAQILWDADKLSKIGLTAAFHGLAGDLARSRKKGMTSGEFIELGRRPDWQEKTVASMHTKPAKNAAKKRLSKLRALWNGLEAELSGSDLL